MLLVGPIDGVCFSCHDSTNIPIRSNQAFASDDSNEDRVA